MYSVYAGGIAWAISLPVIQSMPMVRRQSAKPTCPCLACWLPAPVPHTVMTGFYSYGEISPFMPGAKCELHNQTMTITTLREE